MVVDNVCVYTPGGSQITKKDMVYTPMVGSQKINVIVHTHYEGSPNLNRNKRWQEGNVGIYHFLSFLAIKVTSNSFCLNMEKKIKK